MIELCIWIDSKEDIKNVKKEFKKHIENLPDELTPKFRSGRNQGKKAQLYGSIVTCQIPIVGKEDEFVQIDNIIVLKPEELNFQKSFLNLNAQLQTFFESGTWTSTDREMLYKKAYRQMYDRCYTLSNIRTAEDNAKREFTRLLNSMGFKNVIVSFEQQ